MAQDEQFVSNSNSGGSGGGGAAAAAGGGGGCVSSNRSKNVKQKKIPQRGLGVAQLEKLRLEEQRKREALQAANALANNAIVSGCDSGQGPNINPNPIPTSSSYVSPDVLYRSMCPVQITKQLNEYGGEEIGLQSVCSWGRSWNGEYNNNNVEREKQRVVDHHVGFAFGGPQVNVNLQFESNVPVLALPGGVSQRSYQFQRPPSSMMNVSAGISPSSVSSSQMEPPSIQNVRVSNYTQSHWPEDDKIVVGMKRSYPFSLESPSTNSFFGNFHHTYASSRSRSDEFPSCSGEPRIKYIRDGSLNSIPVPERNSSEDVRLIGDFLTLAPPVAASSPPLSSKNKHTLDYLGHQGSDLSDHRSFSQENLKSSQTHHQTRSGAPSEEQPFSFFPIKSQTDIHLRNGNGEKGEKLDLTLKL